MSEPLLSRTNFTVDDPQSYVDFWLQEFEEHSFDYSHPEPWRLELSTPYYTGTMVLKGQEVTIELQCPDLTTLFDIRGGIGHHLEEFDPRLSEISWSGANTEGELPPNFKLAKVIKCEHVAPSFIRMTIQGDDMSRFGEKGLHFRIVRQQNPDRDPVWPVIGSKGTAEWPEGKDTLLNKVYTTRWFDAATGTLTFDIFQHEGGFTCEWATTNPIGQTVGVMGPGGGWYPSAGNLLMAGDETALPAIARILENAPRDSLGKAIILVPDQVDAQDIDAPEGFEVSWLFRNQGDNLVAATKTASEQNYDYYWFAAHQNEARDMRAFWKDIKTIDRKAMQVVAYWS